MRRIAGTVPFRLERSAESWDTALKESVEEDAEDYKNGFFFRRNSFPLNRLAEFRYAIGPDWSPSNEDVQDDLSVNRLAR